MHSNCSGSKHQILSEKPIVLLLVLSYRYEDAMNVTGLPTLESHRIEMCQKLYREMQNDSHRLHHLLPENRNSKYRLRKAIKYEPPKWNTMRYRNTFVPYCLFNFQ